MVVCVVILLNTFTTRPLLLLKSILMEIVIFMTMHMS